MLRYYLVVERSCERLQPTFSLDVCLFLLFYFCVNKPVLAFLGYVPGC